jgi:hypothetical protein
MIDIETQKEVQKEFLSGNLNFPVGTHESVAQTLGLPVEQVRKVREDRQALARKRVKAREAVDTDSTKYTLFDNRGCDLTQPGNRLTMGQLKAIIEGLPDDMEVYSHQYVAAIGMECLPLETLKVVSSFKFGSPDEKQNIMVIE